MKGVLEVDMMIAFILTLLLFVLCADAASRMTDNVHESFSVSNDISSKISRSYGLLSQLSNGRDNEILFSKLQSLNPENVSLRSMSGYYYGSKSNSVCIQRAVYIVDLNDVGILEVC